MEIDNTIPWNSLATWNKSTQSSKIKQNILSRNEDVANVSWETKSVGILRHNTPVCAGSLSWNDYYKCYLYVGFWDGHYMPDGYTDENRPNGASVMLNNGRGIVVWNKELKKWVKQWLTKIP